MKDMPAAWWNRWQNGGPFFGDDRPHTVVTVEKLWRLREFSIFGRAKYWYHPEAVQTEIPNIERVEISRSIEQDAATCTITLNNTWHSVNGVPSLPLDQLGKPGYFTFNYGETGEAQARWGQAINEWHNVLIPNALIRTFQGFGGHNKTLAQAVTDKDLVLSGVWLIDEVRPSTNGTLEIKCRDLMKLLIEQHLYPPAMWEAMYPPRFCRYFFKNVPRQVGSTPVFSAPINRSLGYTGGATSSSDVWFGPNADVHGHRPTDAFDGNPNTFWLSVGNQPQDASWATDYIEMWIGGQDINSVYVSPWAGGYQLFISIMTNGFWQDGGFGGIPYSINDLRTIGGQPGSPDTNADIPFSWQGGMGWETPQTINFPTAYHADKVRLTFRHHTLTQWGPYPYRAGVREASAGIIQQTGSIPIYSGFDQVRHDGNYIDYSDIIKILCIWGGFWLHSNPVIGAIGPPNTLQVIGNIESTGAFSDECITEDVFDKRPMIDAIHTIKEIVGYLFYIDDEGGCRFYSPNWWTPGNYLPTGAHTNFVPVIDEKQNLINYGVSFNDEAARSEIIISTEDPTIGFDTTITTRYTPPYMQDINKGIHRQAMWVNGVFTNPTEQLIMAQLIALHIFFSLRIGQAECVANPAIQLDDQVQIFERNTGESYIHYVRGISSTHDLESGQYTMSLTTHWLSDSAGWFIDRLLTPAERLAILPKTRGRGLGLPGTITAQTLAGGADPGGSGQGTGP